MCQCSKTYNSRRFSELGLSDIGVTTAPTPKRQQSRRYCGVLGHVESAHLISRCFQDAGCDSHICYLVRGSELHHPTLVRRFDHRILVVTGDGIIENIKRNLRPDTIGFQECDSPSQIADSTSKTTLKRSKGCCFEFLVFAGCMSMHVLPLSIVLFHIGFTRVFTTLPFRQKKELSCLKTAMTRLLDTPATKTDLSGTGRLTKASDFKGAQGVMIREGRFRASNAGSRDLEATGKWGPRYVTWVKLTAAWLCLA